MGEGGSRVDELFKGVQSTDTFKDGRSSECFRVAVGNGTAFVFTPNGLGSTCIAFGSSATGFATVVQAETLARDSLHVGCAR